MRLFPVLFGSVLLLSAMSLAAAEETKSQVAILQEKVKADPDNPTLWNDLGAAYGQHSEWRNAVLAFKKAVALKKDYAHAWYNLGLAYEKANVLGKAVDAYKQATQIQPQFPEAWLSLGVTYYKLGKIPEAKTVLPTLEEQNAKMAQELTRLLEQPPPVPPVKKTAKT